MTRKNRGSLLAMLVATIVAISVPGCGGGSAGPSETVSLSPATATMLAGATQGFSATVSPTNQRVNWAVSCPATPCGTILPAQTTSGSSATYTAPPAPPLSGLAVTITATAADNPQASKSATVTVTPDTSVTVNPGSATVEGGATAQFTASVSYDPQNQGVTWTVACSPAPCGTISPATTASGVPATYSAPPAAPESNLPVTITATSVLSTAASGSANVTVPAITGSLTPASALIPLNVTQAFTATVANDPANKGVAWALTQGANSCSPGCGTISPSTTASGAPATYTAPAALPANPLVTVTVTSVSDNTKSTTSTVTLTTGSVKLVPFNLDFGGVAIGKTSPVQTTVLTNTGTSTLSVQSITVAGTNAGDFSLSPASPCAASLALKATCTIGVTFTPAASGSRSGILSISDTSTDSPQQLSLTGTGSSGGIHHCAAQIKETLSGPHARKALATFGAATVPPPSGTNSVGTRLVHLVDSNREDPFLENGSKRELMVRFWYPAALNQSCQPAQYTSPSVWSYFSQLMSLPLPEVSTNSCQDAPVADAAHPVVVFTHGYTGTFTDYTYLFEDLASRGYIVASVDHTYEATAVEFPDGRFVYSGFGSHLGRKTLEDEPSLTFALSVRLDDLKFVAGELDRLNRSKQGPFSGKLDTSKMAIAGHSMGGLAASLAVDREARYKAGVIIDVHDGYIPDAVIGTTRAPVFVLASGREQWSENECKLWNNLRGPRFAVNFEGAEHLTPSDAVWLARGAVKTGTMGTDRTVDALREYIAAFLDANLRDLPVEDPRLTQPTREYPDVAVMAPGQPLCGKDGSHAVLGRRAAAPR